MESPPQKKKKKPTDFSLKIFKKLITFLVLSVKKTWEFTQIFIDFDHKKGNSHFLTIFRIPIFSKIFNQI